MYFYIPTEWDEPASNRINMVTVRMEQLKLQVGNALEMEYGFGTTWTLHIELPSVSMMKHGANTHYSHITVEKFWDSG